MCVALFLPAVLELRALHFAASVLEQAQIIPVPVVTLSTNQNLIETFRDFMATRGNRFGIRIFFDEIDASIAANVGQLAQSLYLAVAPSHLFIDLQAIPENYVPPLSVALPPTILNIPNLAQWNTVTLAGTGYPSVLDISAASTAMLPRTEWILWNNVMNQISNRVKRLDFGDYAIQHPEVVDFEPWMKISPKIIYAIQNDWIACKGRPVRTHTWNQTFAMCQQLVQRPEFMGAAYSAGDGYIAACAQQQVSCGNSKTWKQVGTNHHITFVANQVANVP